MLHTNGSGTDAAIEQTRENDWRRLSRRIASIGLRALRKTNAPIPLMKFVEMVALQAGVRVLPDALLLSDGVKAVLLHGNHRRLRFCGPERAGIGYIFDLKRRETWPVVSFSRP